MAARRKSKDGEPRPAAPSTPSPANVNAGLSTTDTALAQFDQAVKAAGVDPGDESPWDRLEETAAESSWTGQLLDFYQARVSGELPEPVLSVVCRRAVRFAADCFGENAPEMVAVLRKILEVSPTADWAFRHLVVSLSMTERWSELLDAYDGQLAAGKNAGRRKELLAEAANVAKDFARDSVRAIGYLDQLYRIAPADEQVAASLERLLERQERWDDLIGLWRHRLEKLSPVAARSLRQRIAVALYERLRRPQSALEEARLLPGDEHEDGTVTSLLERLLGDEAAGEEVRLGALELLRHRYQAAGRRSAVPELLKIAIGFAQGATLPTLRRECGERLLVEGDATGALDQYVALAALAPEDLEVEDRLRQLAEAARDPGRLASGLAAAAAACPAGERRVELLLHAARVHDRQLENRAEAAVLLERALGESAASREVRLEALRRLEELQAELGDDRRRLDALERLAAVEPKRGEQRLVWARAAELAARLGDVDRAVACWEARLRLDPADADALAAQIRLLAEAERWRPLVEVLRRRVDTTPPPHQIRADLIQIATVARDGLRDLDLAITTWREVTARFGEDGESVAALADLLTAAGRFAELAELLGRQAVVERRRQSDSLTRLGDAHRGELGQGATALDCYRRALDQEPAHEGARAGLGALLADPALAPDAAEALAAAAEKTGSFPLVLQLLPHRLGGAPERRVRLLRQAAAHAPEPAAFEWLCQALPLAPSEIELEAEVLRLAEATGDAPRAARALAAAIAAGGPPRLLAHLHEQRGRLLEQTIGDREAARESYAAALALVPGRLEVRTALVRTAAAVGRWGEAAAAAIATDGRDALLSLYESQAGPSFRDAALALAAAIEQAAGLARDTRRDLHARVAGYFMDQCPDPDAADAALERALATDPGHLGILRQRAELQRRRGDRRLHGSLIQLSDLAPGDLDAAREAAEVALRLGAESLALESLGRLWAQAVRLLRLEQPAAGQHQPADVAAFALEETVRLHGASGTRERIGRATAMLLEGARLGFPDPLRRQWLRRAAEMTEAALGDKAGAIRIWRLLAEETPGDEVPREALARLYEEEQRYGEAVGVRAGELQQTTDPARRLALRLDIVRLCELFERQSSAPEVLRANLGERPGHPPSLAKLTDVLTAKGRRTELADVLDEQARILEQRGEGPASAVLWAQLARLAEQALGDRGRAIAAWQHVAELDATAEALDALGRLEMLAGQPARAAAWLDRRLEMTEGAARPEVSGRLARAYLAAGQRHRAIACLDRALGESPRADELRSLLGELYHAAESWELEARVVAEGCELVDDPAELAARARRAVELYGRVGMLAKAVPVLEKAVRLNPDDETFRSALADGLARSGRLDEARTLLGGLIEAAGWRRSRKRATLHHRLAKVAHAQGDLAFALDHLEQASSMDVSSVPILQDLGEVAEAAGAPEGAERAYRALLMLRRKDDGHKLEGNVDAGLLGVAELLLRLHDLARKRGESGEAAELLESALAAAVADAGEAARLQRVLLQRGAHDVLARLFDKRLAQTAGSPAQADVYAEVARSLRAQSRLDEAFDAQMLAVEMDPERADLHKAVLEVARAEGKVERLAERLIAAAGKRRRRAEAPVATALLLRAAELVEEDLGDLARALELARRAEEAQPGRLEVLHSLARIAGKRGDRAECARLVGLIKQQAAEATAPAAIADALFRAAGLELAHADTRAAGLTSLSQALEHSGDVDRAQRLVDAAKLPHEDLVQILPVYERVARQSRDERMLLDYLERRAATPEARPAEVREAIDLAVALDRTDKVEPLLLRLADLASGRPDGGPEAAWAMLELVQRKKAVGDFEAAARALERAAAIAWPDPAAGGGAPSLEPERVLALARDLSERAARAGQLRLGAELLERLRARAPGDESLWRPLLAHYVQLRDREGLDRLVAETLPLLAEVAPRNELRLARVRFVLATDDRDPAAAESLRDVLLEEPGQPDALALLADLYERTGADGELVELLEERFESALQAGVVESVVETALRLGDVLDRRDRERASRVYDRALAAAPGRRPLLRRVLARTSAEEITRERAALMEELLAADAGAELGRLTLDLAAAWTRLGDEDAARRVLEKGCALAPGDAGIGAELESWYRAHEAWGPLADLLAGQAGRESDDREGAALLREAATLRAERLGEAAAAVELLRRARQRAPEDPDLVAQLARGLADSGDLDGAVAELRATLDRSDVEGERRLPLMLLAAELDGARGDLRSVAATLEQAYRQWPDAAGGPLAEALTAWRAQARAENDAGGLRDATLGLVALLRGRGDVEDARALLDELLVEGAADLEIARMAYALAEAAADPEGALAAGRRLVVLEQGEAKIAAAEQLADLAQQIGRPADAAQEIEVALAALPGEPRLRARLLQLYEKGGEARKLGLLLYDQASATEDDVQRLALLTRAGGLLVEAGDGAAAMMPLNDAVALRPGDEEVTLLLSDAYALAGALQEAADLLKPLLAAHKGKISPAVAALYVRMARIAARAGDTRSELQALARALEADKKNGTLAAELADRAEAVGDDEIAMKALRAITLHGPAGPISIALAFLRQARIAHRRGDGDRAVLFARRAAQEAEQGDPALAESRAFLKSVGAG